MLPVYWAVLQRLATSWYCSCVRRSCRPPQSPREQLHHRCRVVRMRVVPGPASPFPLFPSPPSPPARPQRREVGTAVAVAANLQEATGGTGVACEAGVGSGTAARPRACGTWWERTAALPSTLHRSRKVGSCAGGFCFWPEQGSPDATLLLACSWHACARRAGLSSPAGVRPNGPLLLLLYPRQHLAASAVATNLQEAFAEQP